MLSDKDLMMWQEHNRDLWREMARERLIRQVLAANRREGFHHRALAWLGDHLVMWGYELQRRYSESRAVNYSESLMAK